MNILINPHFNSFITNILNIYMKSMSLPMGFIPFNLYVLLFIITGGLLSYLFTSNLIFIISDYFINYKDYIILLIISFTIFNLFYLKFNILIRLFIQIFKSLPYFYKSLNNKIPTLYTKSYLLKIMITYYLINIIFLLLSIFIIYKINNSLSIYNNDLYSITNIYSNLIATILGLIYIDYISSNEFKIINRKYNILFIILGIFILIIPFTYIYMFGLPFKIFNTIYCQPNNNGNLLMLENNEPINNDNNDDNKQIINEQNVRLNQSNINQQDINNIDDSITNKQTVDLDQKK
jgi:hypothetical protein